MTPRYFYRFRSAYALLQGYQELENQEMYFSHPRELNDPLEAFKDIYWRADRTVWTNLLKHYLLCLVQAVWVAVQEGQDHKFTDEESFVFSNEDSLADPGLKADYRRMCKVFFEDEDIAALPELLSQRTSVIRRDELANYLRLIHLPALNAVLTGLEESNRLSVRPPDDPIRTASRRQLFLKETIEGLNRSEAQYPERTDIADVSHASINATWLQTALINDYNGISMKRGVAWRTLISEFPSRHVVQLEKLLYRDAYVACFVEDPAHAAMWGNYADSHKGVCLKFRSHPNSEGAPAIKLGALTFWQGNAIAPPGTYADTLLTLRPVTYTRKLPEIDFFQSLGVVSAPELRHWFADASGRPSELLLHSVGRTDASRRQYWDAFTQFTTTKLMDWKHESEHRAVFSPRDSNFKDPANRKLRYSFEDLEAIIFGMRTSNDDKLAIMRIIEKKCREAGRSAFEFRQAYYSSSSGKMTTQELRLITFA